MRKARGWNSRIPKGVQGRLMRNRLGVESLHAVDRSLGAMKQIRDLRAEC